MATEDKNKRLVNIEIEDDVKRLTITGQDEHDQVVMRQELGDDELDGVAGGSDLSFDIRFKTTNPVTIEDPHNNGQLQYTTNYRPDPI